MIILSPGPYRLGILRLLSNPRVYQYYLTTTRRNRVDGNRQSDSRGLEMEGGRVRSFPSETDKPDVQEWQCQSQCQVDNAVKAWEAPGFDPVVQCGELIGQPASGAGQRFALGRRCRPIAADSATTCASDWSGASGRSTD